MTIKREELKKQFLYSFLSQDWQISPLPSDASFRKYDRVIAAANSYILMDCPPEHYSVEPFIQVAEFLRRHGFSAPEIYHVNSRDGFLILEDFGSISIKQYLLEHTNSSKNKEIYKLIIDVLIKLQSIQVPNNLDFYTPQLLLKELELYVNWYLPFAANRFLHDEEKSEFFAIWQAILSKLPDISPCIVLRDYHGENMMYIGNREGIQSMGLLDFQDAIIGSPAYDLVSVLEDARMEISHSLSNELLEYYLSHTPISRQDLILSYHILGAQRNSRIVGIFARKAQRDNQPTYLKYIPWVLQLLKNDLSIPLMQPLKIWIEKLVYFK